MLLPLLLAATLASFSDAPVPVQSAMAAQAACLQFVQVRMGARLQPDEMKARVVPKREGELLVDGKVKGPEGPLLFACHLRRGKRWELLNFSLWAPQPIKGV